MMKRYNNNANAVPPNPLARRFDASNEKLPQSDPRDAAIKSLNSLCRQLIEIAHCLTAAKEKLDVDIKESPADPKKISDSATTFGTLRERFRNLRKVIIEKHDSYVFDQGMCIHLIFTDSGIPIRVHEAGRKDIWEP